MKYNYNGRNITLNDELTARYKEMNGGLADLDIDIFLDNEKITHPDFNINNVTDEELSIIVKKQMEQDLENVGLNVINISVDNTREMIDRLKRNKEKIAMNISESTDYYSFLQGFDYVIDKLSQVMN